MCRILLFLFVSFSFTLNAQSIERIEPSNWWVNMVNSQLQLMVHGEDISQLTPTIIDPRVQLTEIHRTDNPNYLFIDLTLSPELTAGSIEIAFKRDHKTVLTHQYPILSRQAHSKQRQGFSSKDVIYLITPDRFANGDARNDNVAEMAEGLNRSNKGGRHGGDIQGIIDHLDYIKEMGFTQIWLNPVLENNMTEYSYHGYSTTDYYAVDPRLGSNALYQTLSTKAKSQGLGIIMDVILNHIGSEHWWMTDMPSKDWLNQHPQYTGTNHFRESLHDPYAAKADKDLFHKGWFVTTMPDLNQQNPLVTQYLIQNVIWWIETADLSGVRVDTYSYSDKAFLAAWTAAIMQEYPNFNIVGEEWSINPAIVAYWQKDSPRHDNYPTQLPSLMDFPLQEALIHGLKEKESWSSGLIRINQTLANDFLYGDPYNLVTFPDNHDMSRIYTRLDQDVDLVKMALAFFATTRGIPQIFYGTEILMPGSDDHGELRADFPGGWSGDKTNALTGKGLTDKQIEVQQYTKTLLNWRKQSDIVQQGKLTHYNRDDGMYVYFRHLPNTAKKVMVVMNKNAEVKSLNMARFSEVLGNAQRFNARNVMTDESIVINGELTVPKKQTLILEIE
ncbi:alpha-amlyase [Parashewanella spongiae]|uniref:Alpha-amlyase n=1 Tax=Parashewanella spongiae TaxID=342950 RepID=A0A3A6TXF7_9GAMM|nr:glycoside hydrolase family 13 protein [Parashewanella spongiae]MCL1077982.1 glycoside hydrolase family 13 protein [Parashewanella spongiae]RJY16419.1 alpha-amlyase [Parashewanella spongiae]